MIPIRDLLNRIRWDADFARGEFVLGYFDRLEDRIVRVPFRELLFRPDVPDAFRFVDAEGQAHHVPLHRVREVWKDGQRIWHRPLNATLISKRGTPRKTSISRPSRWAWARWWSAPSTTRPCSGCSGSSRRNAPCA